MKSKGVNVKLEGKALELVLDEQLKRVKQNKIRGKSVIINQLLTELYQIKNKK